MTTMLIQPEMPVKSTAVATRSAGALSAAAKARLEATEGHPLLLNDWVRTLFIHYEVDAEALQPLVPYELDLRGGRAYVSLVAFTMRRLRPCLGGKITQWLSAPVSNHGFLNVRTYVKHQGEAGIFFLAEWLPNRLSVFIGPRTFGLPYRYGRLDYRHDHERGELQGKVTALDTAQQPRQLRYRGSIDPHAPFQTSDGESLTEFLVERYTAFTERRGVRRLFRIWHEPWPQTPVDVEIDDESLIELSGDWLRSARRIGANYSPGALDVWIGRPQCISGRYCSKAFDLPGRAAARAVESATKDVTP